MNITQFLIGVLCCLNIIFLIKGVTGLLTLLWIIIALIFYLKSGVDALTFLFGFSIPILPLLGPQALISFSLFYLLTLRKKIDVKFLFAWAPWILLFFAWAIFWNILEFDLKIIQQFYSDGDIGNLILTATPLSRGAIDKLSLWISALGIFSILVANEDLRRIVTRGMIYGVLPVFLVALVQKLSPEYAIIFPAFSLYWQAIQRIPATLSDPNALGLWAFLSIHLAFSHIKNLTVIAATVICLTWLGLVSGSRTFLIGILLSLLQFIAPKKRSVVACIVVIFILVSLITYSDMHGYLQVITENTYLPEGLNRFIAALSFQRLSTTLESRTIFFQVGGLIWLKFPIIGVGLGNYSFELPAVATQLAVLNEGWSDNSNSFYIGVLAELGLLGLLILYLTVTRFSLRTDEPAARFGLLSFLALLLLGPHIDFPEIFLTLIILSSFVVVLKSKQVNPAFTWGLTSIALIAIFARFSTMNYGFYNPEFRDGRWYMWSAREARIAVPCPEDKCSVELSSLVAGEKEPIDVIFSAKDIGSTVVEAQQQKINKFEYKLSNRNRWFDVDGADWKSFDLESQKIVRPSTGESGDARALGVQVTIPLTSRR